MKIAILQFAPELREVGKNIARADSLLQTLRPGAVDILVLPELAFSGYNFRNFAQIRPFLEPTAAGPTARWARETASRLQCLVSVGYPEISSEEAEPEPDDASQRGEPRKRFKTYNALLTVNPSGTLVAHYRKTNLYYTDVTWSWPNPDGFHTIDLEIPSSISPSRTESNVQDDSRVNGTRSSPLAPTAFAICMDFNPKQFTASWDSYEVATHVRETNAKLLVASNAWLTHKSREQLEAAPNEHDSETLSYWLARLRPLMEAGGGWKATRPVSPGLNSPGGAILQSASEEPGREDERIVVIANRVGIEPGDWGVQDLTRGRPPVDLDFEQEPSQEKVEVREEGTVAELGIEPSTVVPGKDAEGERDKIMGSEARYAGSSCVLGMKGDGRIRVYGLLGCAEENVLVVDTNEQPEFMARLKSTSDDYDS